LAERKRIGSHERIAHLAELTADDHNRSAARNPPKKRHDSCNHHLRLRAHQERHMIGPLVDFESFLGEIAHSARNCRRQTGIPARRNRGNRKNRIVRGVSMAVTHEYDNNKKCAGATPHEILSYTLQSFSAYCSLGSTPIYTSTTLPSFQIAIGVQCMGRFCACGLGRAAQSASDRVREFVLLPKNDRSTSDRGRRDARTTKRRAV